jgi:hypothetical protein
MTSANDMCMLCDAKRWITDTSTTVHITSHDNGMKGATNGDTDSTTMGNGNSERMTTYVNVAGTICDNQESEVKKAVLSEVAPVPTAHDNLFSLSRIKLCGWQLHVNNDAIQITTNGNGIWFDIKISTRTGTLYCMYSNHCTEI